MRSFLSLVLVCPLSCALAQTPPESRPATPVPPVATGESPKVPTPILIPQVSPDTVVLKVGDDSLTAGQFDKIVDLLPEQSRAFVRGPGRKKFGDQIVKVMVLAEEARRQKLDQSPDFQLLSLYRNQELLMMLLEKTMSESIKIDDATLRQYYEAHKAEWERVRARHILVRFQGSAVPIKPGGKDLSDEEALAKAKNLAARIKGGEDFAKLASTESDDAAAAARDGEVGWFGHGQMVPSFEEAAYKLKPGEISEPVKTPFGYHIIQAEEEEFKPFDELKGTIDKRLRPEMTQKAIDEMEGKTKIEFDPTFFLLAQPDAAPKPEEPAKAKQ